MDREDDPDGVRQYVGSPASIGLCIIWLKQALIRTPSEAQIVNPAVRSGTDFLEGVTRSGAADARAASPNSRLTSSPTTFQFEG
jgi:hypothetical protein